MKRFVSIFVATLFIMSLANMPLYCKKAKISGTWLGTTVIPTGQEISLTLELEKIKRKKYSGTVSDASGMLQNVELKEIKYKKKRLTCFFEFTAQPMPTIVSIELTVAGDTMTGTWVKEDDGSQGTLKLKKETK